MSDNQDFSKLTSGIEYHFFDFGCSTGGSLQWASLKFADGKPGLGIDISQNKVAMAVANGNNAIVFDILNIPHKQLVGFTTMVHFLEHVPDVKVVEKIIRKACIVSADFVLIKQPYFDADPFLFHRGMKLFWSDWRGHPNRMTSLELHSNLVALHREGLIGSFSIHGAGKISSSSDDKVHSVASLPDQHQYNAEKHPAKHMGVVFDFPVFSETIAFIAKPGFDIDKIRQKLKTDIMFFSSA